MQIRVIAVGKIKEKFLQDGIAEYEKRLRPYVKLQITELAEGKRPVSASPSESAAAKDKEGERILLSVPAGSWTVAMDVNGISWSSEDLAASLRDWEICGRNQITFIIGGDLGLSPAVLAQSDLRLSLSRMTFTHPMVRFLLLEQIYRACRIKNGEPYHK